MTDFKDHHHFTFTGKERDEETGYGYFGARYMDHELMTMWLSVDPMADKYPSISPYNYCMWNPVKLIDSDGRDVEIEKNEETKTVIIRANFYYNKENIGADADIFIEGLKAALASWQRDINEALTDASLGATGYDVNFEFSFTECTDPEGSAREDKVGNWISNNNNIPSDVAARVRECNNLQVDFGRKMYSSIDENPLFYGNDEYQGTLKHEIGHIFDYSTDILKRMVSIQHR